MWCSGSLHKGAQGLGTLLSVREPDTTHHIRSKTVPVHSRHHCMLCGVLESDRIHKIRGQYSTHSGQCSIWTSMKPRVNARSVHGWGQTLHSGIQLAGTCWCWSRTEHGTPWSLLQSLLDLASAPSQGLWPLSLVLESYSRG